jgi:peptidoglycan-N-acetylmuramic acid deacetylase
MKILFLKIILLCIAFLLLAQPFSTFASESRWYVVRNSEHKQPACDTELSYIEEYGGYYIDKRYNDASEEKVIYLTFDVGYENGNVAKTLDILKEEGVNASFFILEHVIKKNPDLVLRMVNEGHNVCNHTSSHKNLTNASKEEFTNELCSLEAKYKELTGRVMTKCFRPPEGTFNTEMLKRASELGYKTVFWSFAYADWDNKAQMSEGAALKKILDNIHNGEIMLLHPTGATNVKILKAVIKELKAQGYRFATLDKL